MTGAARHAIYFAPAPESALWRFGSAVLGYDAATGAEPADFVLPGFTPEGWREATADPRGYGFHATLKAPFRLAGSEAELRAELRDCAGRRKAFCIGPVRVAVLGPGRDGSGFAAIVPEGRCAALAKLERAVVTTFDRFRAPLTEAERARRRPDALSSRQRAHLEAYGYPFVLEDFRFHMTLTGRLAGAAAVAQQLDAALAAAIGREPVTIDALVLFRQPGPGTRFAIVERMPLSGG